MTDLTNAADRAGLTAPARPRPPARNQRHSLAGVLGDPRMRLAAGTAVLLVTARAARRPRVSRWEATAFWAVNGLPDSLYPPVWAVMQLGTLGAAPGAAGAAWLSGDRKLAGRLPRRRHRNLGAFQACQADRAPSPAGDPASRHPLPWPRRRRPEVPVRARGVSPSP
jgi:hypothetical protein